ncbi:VCBS domain-containing protein, partial [Enterovibrio norvegicus]|uniref:VCBS domain-containing protein n=1 Tax=Enterovibrio norvegicus TaxID=188144 RepID=UPI0018E91D73
MSLTGTDDAAQISGTTTGTVAEGDIGDVSTATGELSIVDPDGEPVNFPDANVSGEYGSLTLVDGAWTYTLDQDATQSLNQDQEVTETITVTASDGTTQDITITVTGTDDGAEVSGQVTGSVDAEISREIGDNLLVNGDFESYGNDQSQSWNIVADDDVPGWYTPGAENMELQQGFFGGGDNTNSSVELDAYNNITIQQDVSVGQLTNEGDITLNLSFDYGSRAENSSDFEVQVLDQDGNVLFTHYVDNNLQVSEIGNLDFDIAVPEGTQGLTLAISGEGASDSIGAIIDNVGLGLVTETIDSATGTINITDTDSGDTPAFDNTTIAGEYGSLTLTNGEWTYTVDPEKSQSIGGNEVATDTITLTATDGTTQDIVISVTGTDDVSEITGTLSGEVTEGDIGDVATATGELNIVDPDGDPVNFPDGSISGEYGSLSLVDGAWTYTADNASIQSLADGDTATDTITVTASDGTTQDIVITIT